MNDWLFVSLLFVLACCCATLAPGASAAADTTPPTERVEQALDISPVWAGHPVGFALLTHGDRQFVAFYDDQRRMTVGVRKLSEAKWDLVRLPEAVVWDSHNYITMTVDDDGFLHLSGNMHAVPLVYFRTTRPLDIHSFERVPQMVGSNEKQTTYPAFFRGPSNELVFTYRDGYSGNGNQIYNVYDLKTRTWSRLLDKPLTDGEGLMNAYLNGPSRGPDGYYHLIWVWRDHPGAESNHDLSYARSKDLRHWEKSDGTPLSLPITLASGEIVDPVPAGGGIINGNTAIGFDSQKRPILSYHKYDENGKTQLYNARREANGWKIYRITDWDYRWDFGGGGSLIFEVRLRGVRAEDGKLSQWYQHSQYGKGSILLDDATLKPIETRREPEGGTYPPQLAPAESTFPGMEVRWLGDTGRSGEPGVRYVLRWETLTQNRDQPRKGDLPAPSTLRLYKLRTTSR